MPRWNLIPPCEWLETEQQVIEAGTYLSTTPHKEVAFDTETTGLHYIRDYPLMFSLSDGVRRFAGLWGDIGNHPGFGNHYAIKDWILENPAITIIMTNAKFDTHMSANRGVMLQGPMFCTLVMDWLHDENRWNHDLKATARDHCGIKMRDFKQVFPMKPKRKNQPPDTAGAAILRKISTPEGFAEAKEYAGLDAFASFRVKEYLMYKLLEEEIARGYSYWQYFLDWEVPFTRVLWNMERRGFMLATGHLKAQIGPLTEDIEKTMSELAHTVGHPVNPQSPKQLQKLFFEELNRVPTKWTKGGKSGIKQPSTDSEVLGAWVEDGDPIAKLILECRSLVKTRGTYIEGPLALVDDNLRIHTQLKQHGTVTGRLSSKEPNLQNLPRPGSDKYRIREAFVAPPWKALLVRDYEQLEMRIMAHFSQDPRMLQAILDGLDLHCFTVSLMYGYDYDEVIEAKKAKKNPTDRQQLILDARQAAKAIGFGLIYGIGPKKLGINLSADLGKEVTLQDAQGMISRYFGIFQGVQAFIKSTHHRCKKTEFVRTIIGRKRRLPGINAQGGSDDDDDVNAKGIAAMARRQSVNSIIQGTAADIAKAAMIRCEMDPELRTLDAQLLMQIHDELIFEVPDNPETKALVDKRVVEIMEEPFPGQSLSVPIPTDGSFAYTWADAK
jgi:DNA polymerase I-like protein with 3'-5' exonuclease and polymerase domains